MRSLTWVALAIVMFAAVSAVVLTLGLPLRTLFWLPLLAIGAVGAMGIGAQIRLMFHRRDERRQG